MGDILHNIEARGVLNVKLLGTIWPRKKPALEEAIKEVIQAFDTYIAHYESNAELRQNSDFFGPDHSYKSFAKPPYTEYEDREDKWSRKNFWLLCNYVVKLNRFADAVRKYSNPTFYLEHGKFLILDSLGHHFGGQNTIYLPTAEGVKKGLADVEAECKELNPKSSKRK